jgi:hypothetical protein
MSKSEAVVAAVRTAVLANPFISSAALAAKLQLDFGFPISRQLANAVVRQQVSGSILYFARQSFVQ